MSHLFSKSVGKDILGGVKETLTLARGPLNLVPIPALAQAVDVVLGIITAVEVRVSSGTIRSILTDVARSSERVRKQKAIQKIVGTPQSPPYVYPDPHRQCKQFNSRVYNNSA
jgi:hypothetical protein